MTTRLTRVRVVVSTLVGKLFAIVKSNGAARAASHVTSGAEESNATSIGVPAVTIAGGSTSATSAGIFGSATSPMSCANTIQRKLVEPALPFERVYANDVKKRSGLSFVVPVVSTVTVTFWFATSTIAGPIQGSSVAPTSIVYVSALPGMFR